MPSIDECRRSRTRAPFRWRSNVTALRHDSSFAVCTELTRSRAGACGPNVPDMLLNHYR